MITLQETYNILLEKKQRIDSSRDRASISNKFTTKPLGIIISDSYNNPFFPIRPRPKIDTAKNDLLLIHRRFRELYGKFESLFLPWHFCVEMVEDRYVVFNTRPIDLRFPISSNEMIKRKKSDDDIQWDEVTKLFFKEKPFDISEAIHILIIGDSNLDIYTQKTYEIIGRTCIVPFIRYFRMPEGVFQRTFPLNVGRKFKINNISKFIRR